MWAVGSPPRIAWSDSSPAAELSQLTEFWRCIPTWPLLGYDNLATSETAAQALDIDQGDNADLHTQPGGRATSGLSG